jgi:hypothetical protein
MKRNVQRRLRRAHLRPPSQGLDRRIDALLGAPAERRHAWRIAGAAGCIAALLSICMWLRDDARVASPSPTASVSIMISPGAPPMGFWDTRSSYSPQWERWTVSVQGGQHEGVD